MRRSHALSPAWNGCSRLELDASQEGPPPEMQGIFYPYVGAWPPSRWNEAVFSTVSSHNVGYCIELHPKLEHLGIITPASWNTKNYPKF